MKLTNSNTPKANHKKQNGFKFFAGGCLLIFVFAAFVVGGFFIRNAYLQTPRIEKNLFPQKSSEPFYHLSPAQQQSVDERGYPEAFTIYFYQINPDEGYDQATRSETWSYYNTGSTLTFIDGDLVSQEVIESPSFDTLPVLYHPEQFSAFMSLDLLKMSTGIQEYLILPLEPEIVQDGQVMYAEQLAFGMKNNRLMYVEVIALTEEQ